MATGAKEQLREEVGDDIADMDWRKLDPRQYDPRRIIKEALLEDFEDAVSCREGNPRRPAAPGRDRQKHAAGRRTSRHLSTTRRPSPTADPARPRQAACPACRDAVRETDSGDRRRDVHGGPGPVNAATRRPLARSLRRRGGLARGDVQLQARQAAWAASEGTRPSSMICAAAGDSRVREHQRHPGVAPGAQQRVQRRPGPAAGPRCPGPVPGARRARPRRRSRRAPWWTRRAAPASSCSR